LNDSKAYIPHMETKLNVSANSPATSDATLKAVTAVIDMPHHAFDEASGAHMLRAAPEAMSPFIGVDSFVMPYPFFGPHPHAGMSAVTVMLPEAEAGFINRDSLGDRSEIKPGDLHWTQAGRGMMHEEIPSQPGKAAHGLQVFVNLTAANKQAAPVAFHVDANEIPVVSVEGGSVRVLAGAFGAAASPIASDARWLTKVNMLDITLQSGAVLTIPVAPGDNAFFVSRSGAFVADGEEHSAQAAMFFAQEGGLAQIVAGSQALRGVFFSGTPIAEPTYQKGPFMGNTAHDIAQYSAAFQRGDMGQLSKSF
jgi:redox-sensitive bicupin YhaK (pirin superfamily)